MKRILFLSDIHIPDQDEECLKIVSDFQRDFKPHNTVLLGDLMNCDQVSSYPNESEISLEDEFDLASDLLDRFKVTHYHLGNHEQRLQRVGLVKKTLRPSFCPVRRLRLRARGIKWTPYEWKRCTFKWGKISSLHGFSTNIHAAAQTVSQFGCCVFGHTHRIQCFQPKHAASRMTGYNLGTLSKLELDYNKQHAPPGHANGFGFMYLQKSGHFNLYTVRLEALRVVIEGRVYSA